MGGASEIIYSILMMENSFFAPNINFNEPDEELARLNIVPETRKRSWTLCCPIHSDLGEPTQH